MKRTRGGVRQIRTRPSFCASIPTLPRCCRRSATSRRSRAALHTPSEFGVVRPNVDEPRVRVVGALDVLGVHYIPAGVDHSVRCHVVGLPGSGNDQTLLQPCQLSPSFPDSISTRLRLAPSRPTICAVFPFSEYLCSTESKVATVDASHTSASVRSMTTWSGSPA